MDNLTCRVCGGKLTYGGRGAIPDHHGLCRTLSNDVGRVKRALQAAWTDAEGQGVRPDGLRHWLVGELWRAINQTTASAIVRRRCPTQVEQLERVIASLRRTRAGREALRARGLDLSSSLTGGELFANKSPTSIEQASP